MSSSSVSDVCEEEEVLSLNYQYYEQLSKYPVLLNKSCISKN